MSLSEEMKPCPFCEAPMMERHALWPSDGDTDSIIHAAPTDCGMVDFSIGAADNGVSTRAAWNRRSEGRAPSPEGWDPEEFDRWYAKVREWSGSAFLAGEPMSAPDQLDHKGQLYSDLCDLGNYLMSWADQARGGRHEG